MPRSRTQPTVASKIASTPAGNNKKRAASPAAAAASPSGKTKTKTKSKSKTKSARAFLDDEAEEASEDEEEEEEEEEANSEASGDENAESEDEEVDDDDNSDEDFDDDDDDADLKAEIQAVSARLREPGEQPREPTAAERAAARAKVQRKKKLLAARAKRMRKARRLDRFAAREALNLHPHSSLKFEAKPTSWKHLAAHLLNTQGVTIGTDAAAIACRAVIDHLSAQIMPDARDRCIDSRAYKTPEARDEARLLTTIQQRHVASAVDADARRMHAPLLVRIKQLRRAHEVLESRRARKLQAQREDKAETEAHQHTIELLTTLEKDGRELSTKQRLELVHAKNQLHATQLARATAEQQRAKKAIANTDAATKTLVEKTIPESRAMIEKLRDVVIPGYKKQLADCVANVNSQALELKAAADTESAEQIKERIKRIKMARTERNQSEKAVHRYEKALKRTMAQLPKKEARLEQLKVTLAKQNAALPELRAKTKQFKKLVEDGAVLFGELAAEDAETAEALSDATDKRAQAKKDRQRAIEAVEKAEDDEQAAAADAAMDESE